MSVGLPLKGQTHFCELLFRFPRRLQIFLRGRQRLVTEPRLHGPDVDSGAEAASGGGVAEAVQVVASGNANLEVTSDWQRFPDSSSTGNRRRAVKLDAELDGEA